MAANESRYELAGVLDAIPPACEFVAEAARYAGLDDREVYHCQLAVDEACTNIVEHGYGFNGADRVIQIVCRSDGEWFTIMIWDDGDHFNPLTRPDPNPAATLEERKNGGWGIYFIKNLMDDVSYARDGNFNQLTMIKQISRTTAN
jgi:serine/threonine-protein kinase RsbW